MDLTPPVLSIPCDGWPPRPFQIVSLFDVLEFQADVFVNIAATLGWLERFCSEGHAERVMPQQNRDTSRDRLAQIRKLCDETGLKMSVLCIDAINLSDNDLTYSGFGKLMAELRRRIKDELSLSLLMQIPANKVKHYGEPRKGWERIIERFPKATTDVEEAWKCFALSRYTAAVFHSVQIVEFGLIELGSFIGVADPLSGWTAVAQRLKRILDKNYPDLTEFEKVNRPFLEQVQGTVEGLKNAWRNKVSHAQGKLSVMTGEEFHPDVAEEILIATRAFMRRLAEGLPPQSNVAVEKGLTE